MGRETDGRNRPIIVRFLDRRQRDRVLDNRRKLKGKRVAISEDLTAANYSLERAAYKHSATAATWTSKGKVFAKLKNGKTVLLKFGENVDDRLRKEMS